VVDAGGERPIYEVATARRFELIDEAGRVRAVLGDAGRGGPFAPGLWFLAEDGGVGVVLSVEAVGASLSFTHAGNTVVVIGVLDPGSAEVALPGAYLVLCRADGEPVLSWRVSADGTLSGDRPIPPGDDPTPAT
jgi:hypothetical protein